MKAKGECKTAKNTFRKYVFCTGGTSSHYCLITLASEVGVKGKVVHVLLFLIEHHAMKAGWGMEV
jgi:hypothetical protein